MNKVSIIINGVRYDSVETDSTGCKWKDCDLFKYCFSKQVGSLRICELISSKTAFKKSKKKF